LIRQVVHFLDGIGRGPGAVVRSAAQSTTVAQRRGYFPEGTHVPVVHPPTGLAGLHTGRGRYLFTASRLDAPKRIDLLIRAMHHVKVDIELRIAGTGPQEPYLRELAASDPRVRLLGFLNETELVDALEAMLSAKPVITTTDAGGPTELIEHRVHGLVVEPDPAAIGRAITTLARLPPLAWWLGRAGRVRAAGITWDRVVSALLDGVDA
jgi:glycosyltransferase involved in cell wall biosynthesis